MIEVAAGIALGEDGAILLGKRKAGAVHGGCWEFPGGKIEAGETPKDALIREWIEELDADLTEIQAWKKIDHTYGERTVRLHLLFCRLTSPIKAKIHADLQWRTISQGPPDNLLGADQKIWEELERWDFDMPDEPLMTSFLNWYETNARALPWRETQDPYRIWLSEIMLQQTRVETVKDYYRRFLERFPSVFDLAQASDEAVMKAWEGLGYYSRARNLHACAKQISQMGGHFPNNRKELLKLPGIGEYTAGAVASFAFGERVPAVDGNVLRVTARWYGIWEDIMKPQTRKLITQEMQERLPMDTATFNQAMMELGATVCLPKNPLCHQCPLEGDCYAKWHGEQAELPIKSKKKKPKRLSIAVGWIHQGDKQLLVKRPGEGLLAGLWGFPIGQGETEESALEALIQYLEETFDLQVKTGRRGVSAEHVFTHRVWAMTAYHFEVDQIPQVEYPEIRVLNEDEFETVAIPTAFQKIIKKRSR